MTLRRSSPLPAALLALAAAAALAAPAAAQEPVLVERITEVSAMRQGDAIVVTVAGTVPISGFGAPTLKARPDLVKVGGVYVLDFIVKPPPTADAVRTIETRLTASFRIEGGNAATIRSVQVRAAAGSRAVQVIAQR